MKVIQFLIHLQEVAQQALLLIFLIGNLLESIRVLSILCMAFVEGKK